MLLFYLSHPAKKLSWMVFYWTLQVSLLYAERNECSHTWVLNMHTFTHNKNQFIVALVPQKEEFKKFLKWMLVLFKHEVLLAIIFLCDELSFLGIFQSELNLDYRGIENAKCRNFKVILKVCKICITTIIRIWKNI